MKGVELKLEEISDSREVMESKESPKIRWFILIFTLLIIVALVFSCVFEIDEYVTVNGEIKTEAVSGNITSLNSCKVEEIKVKEGQQVEKGDVLFYLNVDYAKEQKAIVKSSLDENNIKLDNLNTLLQSVQQNKNLFQDKENVYSYRYEQFEATLDLTTQELENSINSKELSEEENREKLAQLNEQIAENETLIAEYQNLIYCIDNDYAYSGNETVYALYLKYESDYAAVEANEESSWNNYTAAVENFNNQQNNITASEIQQAQITYETALSAVSALTNETSSQINNQLLLLQSQALNTEDEQLTNKIYAYTELLNAVKGGYSFSSEDVEIQQIYDSYKSQYDTLYSDYLDKLSTYNRLYDEYSLQNTNVSESDITNAGDAYNSAVIQKDAVKSNCIFNIQTNIDTLKTQLISLESQRTSVEYALKSKDNPEKYAETSKEKMINEEIVTINSEISNIKDNMESSEIQLTELDNTIKNGTLTATTSGTVSLLADLTIGDVVEAGKTLCIIVPYETSLEATLYIPESEISKIHTGQSIEYVFNAIPYTEFGKVNGTISEISADSANIEGADTKYYLAKANLTEISLTNSKNETRTIQTGQLCQAKIISGSKKVMIWLLEKINLRD